MGAVGHDVVTASLVVVKVSGHEGAEGVSSAGVLVGKVLHGVFYAFSFLPCSL